MSTLSKLIEKHRLIVCVGAGGVGKTTIAAALGVGAAARGRKVAVITIDPARALARALGSTTLDWSIEHIDAELFREQGLELDGALDAAMLQTKHAWDELIRRHATSRALAQKILDNRVYRELSSRFAGSSEYAAIEQLRVLHDSGKYDLIVLDTPPAAHAFDFVRAPDRIRRFLEPSVVRWLRAGRRAFPKPARKSAGRMFRWVLGRVERAAGTQTLKEISSLLGILESMQSDLRARSKSSAELLRSAASAFVLITTPERQMLDESEEMLSTARSLRIPLRAVIVNRTHPLAPALDSERAENEVGQLLEELRASGPFDAEAAFIAETFRDARLIARCERQLLERFLSRAPAITQHSVVELEHEVQSFAELVVLARALDSSPQRVETARVSLGAAGGSA